MIGQSQPEKEKIPAQKQQKEKRSCSRSRRSSMTDTEASSSSEESKSSKTDGSESDGSPQKKKSKKSRKLTKEEKEKKANCWLKIECKKVSEWTWKDPEGINAMRYGTLYNHLAGLHKFRKDHVPKDTGKKAKKACRKLFCGVRREMNLIRIGEMALNKWKTVAEMCNKLGAGNRKLEKAAREADKRINECNTAQAATKLAAQQQQQPFHGGAGGNVAPALQHHGRGRQAALSAGRGQGQVGAQQAGSRNNVQCFRCLQWGHFKSSCPQNAIKHKQNN